MGSLSILSTSLLLSLALGAPQQQSAVAKAKTPTHTSGLAQNLVDAIPIIQAFAKKITHDPHGVTNTWKGPNPCHYKGFKCIKTDQGFDALAQVDFVSFDLGPDLDVTGFMDKLPYVTDFFVRGNKVKTIPADLSHLPFLYYLDLGVTGLSGPFPKALLTARQLVQLSVRSNALEGPIPGEILRMDIEALNLSENKFTNIPSEIDGSTISFLYLNSNQLTGSIPSGVCNTPYLEIMDISKNQLTGFLPTNWKNMHQFKLLDAGYNKLSGSIPESLVNLPEIHTLYFDHNQFSGTLPEMAGAKELYVFDISDNQMTGPVPESLCKLPKLTEVSLANNNFDGELGPACLKLLKKKILTVDGNCIKNAPKQKSGCGVTGNAPPSTSSERTTKNGGPPGKVTTPPVKQSPGPRRNRL